MKNKKAVVKASIAIFSLLAISAIIAFASGVFAFTHDSTASITPDLVQASTPYTFVVTVSNLPSSEDSVSEFRIYMESFGSNPNPFTSIVCNTKSGWNGPFIISSSEGDYCLYTAQSISNRIDPDEAQDFSFDATSPETGSCRTFKFETRDPDQFWRPIEDEVCVDNQAPTTIKYFDGPQKIENGVEWIDGISTVVLTAEDPEPHPAGVDKTFYKLFGPVDDSYCYNACEGWQTSSPNGDGWSEYSGPLSNINESCHVLEFYSADRLKNVENVNVNCFFVDKTPPEIWKDVGDPQFQCREGEECDYFISSETPITLMCEDQEPHPSDDVTIYWRYRVDDEGNGFNDDLWTSTFSEEAVFNFPEPSMHQLEYWCVDAVGKESEHYTEIDKVDNEAPVITKEMIGNGHLGQCPPSPEPSSDECYVADNGENGVGISVEDPNPIHAVDQVTCKYELWWETDSDTCIDEFGGTHLYNFETNQCFVEGNPFIDYVDVIFREDSTHTLKIWCEDALGNDVYDEEEFLVDSTPPETTKIYGEPAYPAGINAGERYPHYITSQTPITLTATDEKVGVDKTYWRNTLVEDRYCQTEDSDCQNAPSSDDPFQEYIGPFNKPEESCHLIEYYSTDKLGNVEEIKKQCVFVDNTPPTVDKDVGEPKVKKGEDLYISQQTPMYLTCQDQEPHPVDRSSLWYRYRISDDCINWDGWTEWIDPISEEAKTIYFEEDSCHELEYYCEDALGNAGQVQREIDIVDSKAPVITKEIIGPYYGQCPPSPNSDDVCYIDGVTEIHVDATDPEPHPVGDVTCEWGYTWNEEFYGWFEENELPFVISDWDESRHDLEIRCWDELGNEVRDEETFFVDKTPPGIYKEYGEPYFSSQSEDYWAEWINSQTPIYISVVDEGPHLSGIKDVEYRVGVVDDDYCKYQRDDEFDCEDAQISAEWISASTEFNFNINEESCHLIEITATDNVDKTSTHKQCVFVDNTAPLPNKTVGEIKTIWDGKDSAFYPDETQYCWSDDLSKRIECWRVTLDTPISLDCSDPKPHPVDHEKTCFQIGLDGEDATEDYCDNLEGDFNETGNGYCCGFDAPYTFNFGEESEHNLKFYCEDALGNAGQVDEEKFKVFGKMWEIPIYKKWNLISVPFDPLNTSVKKVFQEIDNNISAVWTYDGEEKKWYVYRHGVDDGDDTNNLEKIKTGVGYWVLALENETLVVGGSLLSPGPVVPPSNNLENGWNLIGHYGTEPKPVYCSLYSLIDTNAGYPRWSSLWRYNAEDDEFEGLDPWEWQSTEPGRGYWIEMDVEDLYAPSTLCWGFP